MDINLQEGNVRDKLAITVNLLLSAGYAYYLTVKKLCRHHDGHFVSLQYEMSAEGASVFLLSASWGF
jgi:hypothetical protein